MPTLTSWLLMAHINASPRLPARPPSIVSNGSCSILSLKVTRSWTPRRKLSALFRPVLKNIIVDICRTCAICCSCPANVNRFFLHCDEGHTRTGCELHVCHLPIVDAPVHVTGNHIPVAKDALNDGDMSQTVGPFYPGLQVDDRPRTGLRGDMPVCIIRALRPLPGVSVGRPRNIDVMELIVALRGPPGTLSVREEIGETQ